LKITNKDASDKTRITGTEIIEEVSTVSAPVVHNQTEQTVVLKSMVPDPE